MSAHACVCLFAWKSSGVTFLPVPRPSVSAAVFQLQRAADPAGLLCLPAHQQHRQAGSDALHPAHLPPAGRVATGRPVRQRRPAGQGQQLVSPCCLCQPVSFRFCGGKGCF